MIATCGNCTSDQFVCHDGTQVIPKSKLCNGKGGGRGSCADGSHISAAQCSDCAGEHLFKCQRAGKEVCLANKFKCDGINHCDGAADELIANCGNCTSDQFACHDGTQCIPKAWFCNGHTDCADYSDATVVQCNDCADENFFKCQKDGKYVCLANELKCDGAWHCDAQTDELSTECK